MNFCTLHIIKRWEKKIADDILPFFRAFVVNQWLNEKRKPIKQKRTIFSEYRIWCSVLIVLFWWFIIVTSNVCAPNNKRRKKNQTGTDKSAKQSIINKVQRKIGIMTISKTCFLLRLHAMLGVWPTNDDDKPLFYHLVMVFMCVGLFFFVHCLIDNANYFYIHVY